MKFGVVFLGPPVSLRPDQIPDPHGTLRRFDDRLAHGVFFIESTRRTHAGKRAVEVVPADDAQHRREIDVGRKPKQGERELAAAEVLLNPSLKHRGRAEVKTFWNKSTDPSEHEGIPFDDFAQTRQDGQVAIRMTSLPGRHGESKHVLPILAHWGIRDIDEASRNVALLTVR